MNYKNAEILLSISLVGRLAVRGKYEAVNKVDDNGKKVISIDRDKDGNIEKNEVILLKTVQLPSFHESSLSTKLNSDFVKHAISEDARPRTISAPMWRKMSDAMKLNFHVKAYANDMYPGCKYTYTVISGDDDYEE